MVNSITRSNVAQFLDKMLTGNQTAIELYRQNAKDKNKCARVIRDLSGLIHQSMPKTRTEVENDLAFSLGYNVISD